MAPSKPQLKNRRSTLKKKARELQTLCDVMVCMVCFDGDEDVVTWPENRGYVHHIINNYRLRQQRQRLEQKFNKHDNNLDLLGFLTKKKQKLERKLKEKAPEENKDTRDLFSSWEANLSKLSEVALVGLCNCVDSKLQNLREKIKMLQQSKDKGKAIQVYDDADYSFLDNVLDLEIDESDHQQSFEVGNSSNNNNIGSNLLWSGNNTDFGRPENFIHSQDNFDNEFSLGFGLGNFGSMFCQAPPTSLHEALPISTRQLPWPFQNELA